MSWSFPTELRFLRSDEYLRLEGSDGVVGISDYAQDQLNDVVFIELPDVGTHFARGTSFGTIESVKAASDLMMPVAGTVTEVNERLRDQPELINASPYGDGWILKIKVDNPEEAAELLDAAAYEAYCKTR
jgi:glycine cleavage system H protein